MTETFLELCRDLPVAAIDAGGILLAEGATSGLLYVLIDGAVEVLKGDFQVDTVAEPGAIFGEISVLLGIPHMATVRALTPARVHVVAGGAGFLRSHPDITFHLATLLAQRLHGVTGYLVDLKRQFEDRDDHLTMVDDVLEALVHQQRESFQPGSDRDPGV